MSNPPIQSQLSVNQTAGSLITMTMGTMAALASDNVQPIAKVACEMLGGTLAISDNICKKIEAVVVPPTAPASIAFLQAQIGFFRSDSATIIGESGSGIRFLALAAALAPTLPLFDAAKAIELMLGAVISEPTQIPSTRNLKSLLASIEPRCHRAGFADEVLGWKFLLHKMALPYIERQDSDHILPAKVLFDTRPSPEMVHRLVDAFRQLGRIGPSTVTGVTIRLCTAVPWVIAFTKWSLGEPPCIFFEGQANDEFMLRSDSPVTLLIPRHARGIEIRKGMSVTIHHTITGPCELVAPSVPNLWAGMVPIESYGRLLLLELGFESGFANRVLIMALHFAIPQCLELVHFSSFVPDSLHEGDPHRGNPQKLKKIDESLTRYRFRPLPDARKIAITFATLFNLQQAPDFSKPAAGIVSDIGQVRDYLDQLKSECDCTECSPFRGSTGNSILTCEREKFYQRLSWIVATVLSLSLFDSVFDKPASLLLSVPIPDVDVADDVEEAIKTVLELGQAQRVDACGLLKLARRLIAHDWPERERNIPIMTSQKGQVLFPTLFETHRIVKNGYMALSCIPGILRYDNEKYNEVESAYGPMTHSYGPPPPVTLPPVISPLNLFPDLETRWEITKEDDSRLGCTLRVRLKSATTSYGCLSPTDALIGLMYGLFIESCPHDPQTALDRVEKFAKYCGIFPEGAENASPPLLSSNVDIVPVHGANDLRLASISHALLRRSQYYVLRGNACMACCLKLCRKADVDYLIL